LNLGVANRPEWGDLFALRALRRLVREVQPDVIHSHSSKAGFLARTLRYLGCRAAQVYHPHAYVGMRPSPGRFDAVYNLAERLLGRIGWTVVVSSGEHEFARHRLRIPDHQVRLLPNGVDTDAFAPPTREEKAECRVALGLPADRPVLGFMARSCAQKDPVTLYRSFAEASTRTRIALLHVGKGELDREIERLIDDAGIRPCVVRRPYFADPSRFYRAVDGFVLTSRYEGLSLAALEALAANLPMILSEAPGNEDLLRLPLSHGWHAAPGDVAGFAAAIEDWSGAWARGEPVNHRAIACERFERANAYGNILELYRELTDRTGESIQSWVPTAG
jgi:glycosyltransferase involved in cell wall biosynthesis